MVTGSIYGYDDRSPREREQYDRGFEDAYNSLAGIVKKLGKRYYKDFLEYVKPRHNKFYTSSTFTTHKCNCPYCGLSSDKED